MKLWPDSGLFTDFQGGDSKSVVLPAEAARKRRTIPATPGSVVSSWARYCSSSAPLSFDACSRLSLIRSHDSGVSCSVIGSALAARAQILEQPQARGTPIAAHGSDLSR